MSDFQNFRGFYNMIIGLCNRFSTERDCVVNPGITFSRIIEKFDIYDRRSKFCQLISTARRESLSFKMFSLDA